MSFSIFQGRQEGENKFLYFVRYGTSASYNPFYTPNLIKANIKDVLGRNVKISFEREYRKKMNEGKSFQVHVIFGQSVKVK